VVARANRGCVTLGGLFMLILDVSEPIGALRSGQITLVITDDQRSARRRSATVSRRRITLIDFLSIRTSAARGREL